MQAAHNRKIQSGTAYDAIIPRATTRTHVVLKDADVQDTVAFIKKVVSGRSYQTLALAQKLKGATDYETCRNIWQFVYRHIAYRKDEEGKEQVRSPARAWYDRKKGVDCDCYSTFISTVLCNAAIPHLLRITKYSESYFQHIYPVALIDGKEVILDCVTDQFDYEVPYTEKKDYKMELQFLDGLEGVQGIQGLYSDDLLWGMDGTLAALGKAKRSKAQKKKAAASGGGSGDNAVPGSGVKKKKGFKKLLNIANKVNPATVLLRNGILASMKLNIGKAASRLRWSYLTPNQARAKGIDMNRFAALVKVRQKLENIFYGAGGKPENLKKAIIHGKGNKDKQVNGFLGFLGYDDGAAYQSTTYTPLSALLGAEVYHSENVDGMEGLGQLGEPVTAATITAASGVILAIVGAIKKVGDIFGGKGKGAEDFSEDVTANAQSEVQGGKGSTTESGSGSSASASSEPTVETGSGGSSTESGGGGSTESGGTGTDVTARKTSEPAGDGGGSDTGEGFWAKHKKWLLPVSIGVGGITLIAVGMKLLKPAKKSPLQGLPPKRNHHRRRAKPKARQHKTKRHKALPGRVALM